MPVCVENTFEAILQDEVEEGDDEEDDTETLTPDEFADMAMEFLQNVIETERRDGDDEEGGK